MTSVPNQFRPLSLQGGRFEQDGEEAVGVPVEMIGELARYEDLLIKVARELWLREHPGRVRAPKGFEDGLRLRLTDVARGSVQPVMATKDPASGGNLFDERRLVERAQQMIADTLGAIDDGEALPAEFPDRAVQALVPFGRSLRDDEAYHVRRAGKADVVYTQRSRRHLERVVSADDIKIDGSLLGRINGIEANQQSFTFVDRSGARADGAFEQIGMFDTLMRYVGRDAVAPFVRLTCRYSTNERGRLSRIEDVEDVEPIVGLDDRLGAALRDLLALPDGWDEGSWARAPSVVAIEWARDFAAELPPGAADTLSVSPTHEGGVALERHLDGRRWALDIDADGSAMTVVVDATLQARSEDVPTIETALESWQGFEP